MDLSVIIACRNSAEKLKEQLAALARQEWDRPWEVVVADNGSTDDLAATIELFRDEVPGLRLVDASTVRGAGHAHNVGVRASRGRFLAFPDADDVVGAGWLAAMGRALERHPFVACRMEYSRLNDEQVLQSRPRMQTDALQPYRHPPFLPHAAGTSLGVRREVHELVGGFDESLTILQDTDYCWRIQLEGIPLRFEPDALIHYRFRDDAVGLWRQARRYGRYNVLLYKRYRRHGMPPAEWQPALRKWLRLALRLHELSKPGSRMRWIRDFAWRVGRLEGSLKYGVFAP